ncbi:MAG TPA: hypothetical protein VF522_02925 [Ramlibacter sp.]|uniref:hypothetical protein n=1 Tax=Ramlibacter sp. TaxID=1917967 RepID=UPI002ED2E847
MSDTRTVAILQRVPAILAVTANSYGLALQSRDSRRPEAAGPRRHARGRTGDKPAAQG